MDYVLLGQKIQQARRLKRLSQSQLAEKANLSVSFFRHVEKGECRIDLEGLAAIAQVLGQSIDGLLQSEMPPDEVVYLPPVQNTQDDFLIIRQALARLESEHYRNRLDER